MHVVCLVWRRAGQGLLAILIITRPVKDKIIPIDYQSQLVCSVGPYPTGGMRGKRGYPFLMGTNMFTLISAHF